MDRDQRWERTERAYRLYTEGLGLARPDAARAVRESYAEGTTDEFVKPIVLPCPYAKISDGDGIVFFNFRADRARQISRAFSEGPGLDPGFVRRVKPRLATYTTFTRYQKEFPFPVAFDHENILDTFGEVVSRNGLRQLRMAETEKYAHVTFFFNGGRETAFEGEDRILIPSPKVATYDLQPEMSAPLLTKALLENIDSGKYDFILVNYANGDMVGHTGVFEAACQAARTVDDCVGQVAQKVLSQNGALLLTADHGNLERMREDDGIKPYTSHTTNPVPLLWISEDNAPLGTDPSLGLASIAPSLLMKMGLDIPEPMRATPLIFEKHR
jgi:2,3-bisphosphoglycerate-independent phosphoglycerate mutase